MIYQHGSPVPKNKRAWKVPDQTELNHARKCQNCDAPLITFTVDKIQMRACTSCGSLFASDRGLDEIQKRVQEYNDFLDSTNPREDLKTDMG